MKPKVITSMEQAKQVIKSEEMGDYKKADLQWYNDMIEESKQEWSPRRVLTTLNGFSALAIWLYGMVQAAIFRNEKPPYGSVFVQYSSVNYLWIYSLLGAHPKHPTSVDLGLYGFFWRVSIIIRIVCTAVFVYIVVAEGYEDIYIFTSAATAVAMIGVATLIYPPLEYPSELIEEMV